MEPWLLIEVVPINNTYWSNPIDWNLHNALGYLLQCTESINRYYSIILKRRLFRNSYQENLFGKNALKIFKNSKATYSTTSTNFQSPKKILIYNDPTTKKKKHGKIYRHRYNARCLSFHNIVLKSKWLWSIRDLSTMKEDTINIRIPESSLQPSY